jgi:hypothetical protein
MSPLFKRAAQIAQMIVKDGLQQTRQVDFEDASWKDIMTLQAPRIFGGHLSPQVVGCLNLLFRGIRRALYIV